MAYANEGNALLVDDERLVRFTISAWLKAANFSVTAVKTPGEAIAELKARTFDVVISDVMMDDVDGFMFRDSVRGFNPTIPFVFLTALVNSPSNRLLEKIAADSSSFYAPKNARRDYLLSRLRQAVRLCRTEREIVTLKTQVESDLNIAARVQHALLSPPLHYDRDIFYSCLWRPCQIVSGDLFRWYPLDDGEAAVFFGDISGHGTPAALAMTAVMAHLRDLESVDLVHQYRPDVICQRLHDYIRETMPDITYISGTVLFVDTKRRRVRYLNAGGLEPLCYRKIDGSRVELNPERRGGLPMGLVEGARYSPEDVVEAAFPADAFICLLSDGFADQTTDAEGENRLPDVMQDEILGELIRGTSGTTDLASIPYRYSATLSDMGYVHVQDDRTFLLIGNPMNVGEIRFIATVAMNDPKAVNDAVDGAAKWAARKGFPDELVARLELLISEHLENVRKHGLDEDERRHESVVLELRKAGDDLEVMAWDRARSSEDAIAELAEHPDLTLDAQNDGLSESGRGLAILQKVCKRMTHESFDGLNKFTFTMGVKP